MHSFLIRGAWLADGTGTPLRRADVAVDGDRIAAVAPRIDTPAERVIEADGLVLAPGFIDIHSHTDMTHFRHPDAPGKAMQGVSLEVTGNCGLSLFPVNPERREELAEYLGIHDFALPAAGFSWDDFASCADRIDNLSPLLNTAPLVGHAPLRIAAMGMDNRAPDASELARMQELLALSLRQGAWGFSTGLIYPPGSFATTEEVVELARTAALRGGIYASHIRGEGEPLMAALDEAIRIGRESGARVQVSHLKAMGKANRGRGRETLEKLTAARLAGVDVAADQYPYNASATSLSAVVPQWAHDGGVRALLERLRDPALQERLCADIGREMTAREGAAEIVISNCRSERNRHFSGVSVAAVASEWGCTPEEAVIRLLVEEAGSVGAIFFSMDEDDVRTILADQEISVGSDGHALDATADAGEATHPRSYGTFSRVLGHYVREEKLLSLPAAIRKMTALPAARLGFTDRGLVRPGFAADLVLFDPAAIAERSSYADPHHYATGVIHLLVNGRPVLCDGCLTGERPGRVLRRNS
jgi:N-acyl-D-amino-acid deacylase